MENLVIYSQFNLLRTAIAMAYADGGLQDDEKNWLRQKFSALPLKPFQIEFLEEDLKNGVDINESLPKVSRTTDRELLLAFAKNVFLSDGFFDKNEQIWYEKLTETLKIPANQMVEYLKQNPFPPSPGALALEKTDASVKRPIANNLERLIDTAFKA